MFIIWLKLCFRPRRMVGTGLGWGWSRRRRTNASLMTRLPFHFSFSFRWFSCRKAGLRCAKHNFQRAHANWCFRYWKLVKAWLACNMEPTRAPPRCVIIETHTKSFQFLGTDFDLFQAGMTPYGASRQIRPEGIHTCHSLFWKFHEKNTCLCKCNMQQIIDYTNHSPLAAAGVWLHRKDHSRLNCRGGWSVLRGNTQHTYISHGCICWWSFHFTPPASVTAIPTAYLPPRAWLLARPETIINLSSVSFSSQPNVFQLSELFKSTQCFSEAAAAVE